MSKVKNIKRFINEFERFISENRLIVENDDVLIAVSGGLDSVVLLRLLNDHSEKTGIGISVVHFHHHLRGTEADRDASFVETISGDLGVPFTLKHLNVREASEESGSSIQDAAHQLRRGEFGELVREFGYSKIATAHHKDDQLETLLMRLVTGAGPEGMSGIRVREGKYVRPLMFADKNQLKEYAEAAGIEWVEDSSNKENAYLRNRLRNRVIPILKEINPSASTAAARTAATFGQMMDGINGLVDGVLDSCIVSERESEITLAISEMTDYFDTIGYFIIDNALKRIEEEPPTVINRQFDDISKLVKSGKTGAEISLSKGFRILKDRDNLIIYRSLSQSEEIPVQIGVPAKYNDMILETRTTGWNTGSKLPKGADHEVIDFNLITEQKLVLGNWKEGDKIRPLGLKGHKKVSDLLTEAKIPLHRKRRYPVLRSGDEILWVCGIRLNDKYKVTDGTKEVLHLKLIDINLN